MKFRLFLFMLFTIATVNFPAIKIKPISDFSQKKLFVEQILPSDTREKIDLSKNWDLFTSENSESKVKITLPVVFGEEAKLRFRNRFELTEYQIENYFVVLECEDIIYSSEIKINDQSVIKHSFGFLPFRVTIPNEILLADEPNIIDVTVSSELSASTFPPQQRFLMPNYEGGILGGIKVILIPKNHIAETGFSFGKIKKRKKEIVKLKVYVETRTETKGKFKIVTTLFDDSLNELATAEALTKGGEIKTVTEFLLPDAKFWSTENPNKYFAKIRFYGADSLLDEISMEIPLMEIKKSEKGIFLNGEKFFVKGVLYVPFSAMNNPDYSYLQIEKDLRLAKALGFNFIRFANQIPTKTVLKLAQNLGLLASVELPVNFLPENILDDEVYGKIIAEYSKEFIKTYAKFPNVILLGAGSSFIPDSEKQMEFINAFAENVKKNTGKFSFASFLSRPEKKVNADFINVEIYSKIAEDKIGTLGAGNIFITGAYPAFAGSKSGSLVENSFEAQGLFFKKIINFSHKHKLAGFFINSLTDFSGDYNSLYAGYSNEKLYKIGIVGVDRKAKRIGYNVLREKLKNGKNVIIPLGVKKQNLPLLFIVVPLFLAALVAFVLNSRHKFREDATRALLRSYNFFSDIRDMRMLSGFHSYFMFVINSATFSLLFVNILFFLRNNIALDKIIVAFGSRRLSDWISYLAWHPINAFFILFAFLLLLFFLIASVIKFFSVFNETRVFFSNIFYTLVWALMPINLLIPVELLLLKILSFNVINVWIYVFIGIYLFWLLLRLFKGIYVVFDVRPSTVYVYGFGVMFLIIAIGMIILQTSSNGLDYLANAFEQIKYLN